MIPTIAVLIMPGTIGIIMPIFGLLGQMPQSGILGHKKSLSVEGCGAENIYQPTSRLKVKRRGNHSGGRRRIFG
jgi:hypothetical protein